MSLYNFYLFAWQRLTCHPEEERFPSNLLASFLSCETIGLQMLCFPNNSVADVLILQVSAKCQGEI